MPSKDKTVHHRDKIKASVILDRLGKHVMGQVEMTSTQVKSAEILLRKVVPDLSAVTLAGPNGTSIKQDITITLVRAQH